MFKLRSVLVLAALTLGSTAAADIIDVGPGNSIQAAIDAAVDGDEIVVAPGTYNEAIDFVGKAITVRSSGGPEVTTIDAAGLDDTVVKCVSGEGPDAVLDGFTLTGGIGALVEVDPGFVRLGGGMYIEGSSPTVTNCTFSGNSAVGGGGILNIGSSPIVTDCIFSGNTAEGSGGGMANSDSSPTVTDCTFSENTSDFEGGGISNSRSSPTVTRCTFTGNSAGFGAGGMFNVNDSSPLVINCTFTGNVGSDAGAMHNALGSSPMVINCAFSGNEGFCGGGIRNEIDCNPIITNCTLSGNTALGDGGAMCNIANSSPTVTNCILWGNTPDEIFDSSGATIVRYSDIQSGFTGTGNINADPLFVDPDSGDLRLGSGSPCIDAGDNTAVPLGITSDLDGNPRFVDDPDTADTGNPGARGPIVDMGAYELQVVDDDDSDDESDEDSDDDSSDDSSDNSDDDSSDDSDDDSSDDSDDDSDD